MTANLNKLSTTEIITVVKAINDHVANKYCGSIITCLNQKTNAQLCLERQFFNYVDKATQKLVDDITRSLRSAASCCKNHSEVPKHMLTHIQQHCNKYNQLKKNIYDVHLAKIKQMEKKYNQMVQDIFKDKVVQQNTLFDKTVQIHQDIMKLLNHSESVAARIDDDIHENIQNAFPTHDPIQTSPIKTSPTNPINEQKQINQLLSLASEIIQIAPEDANKIIHKTDVITGNSNESIKFENQTDLSTSENSKNTDNNSQTDIKNTTFPPLPPPPLNPQNCMVNDAGLSQLNISMASFSTINTSSANSNSGTQFSINGTDESKMKSSSDGNILKHISYPIAPPKPPPPPKPPAPTAYVSSSSEDNDDSVHGYECTLCDKMFDTPQQWKSHLRKTHLKTRRINKYKHKKSKRILKRRLKEMINESDRSDDTVDTSNKRRRQMDLGL